MKQVFFATIFALLAGTKLVQKSQETKSANFTTNSIVADTIDQPNKDQINIDNNHNDHVDNIDQNNH